MSQVSSIDSRSLEAGSASTQVQRASGAVLLVYVWWALIYFDAHYMVAYYVGGGAFFQRIPIFLLVPMILILIPRTSTNTIYWPMVLFTGVHFVSIFGSDNRGFAFLGFKIMVFFLIAFTAANAVIRKPSQASTLCRIFLLSFPWFFVNGLPGGLVPWHPEYANYDAFGPLGVMGMGYGYFFAMASKPKKWRYLGFGTAILGVLAVVASFARGAFLAAVVVAALAWIRSPRKIFNLGVGVAAIVLVVANAELSHPGGEFWKEMGTISSEGASEGTGGERWKLWTQVGWPVFLESPIFGVGANCTGVVGARVVPPGVIAGRYSVPERLYGFPMHNVYIQILAEEGLVGFALWIGMAVGFFRRIQLLRAPRARAAWNRATGGTLDLYYLALGLEAAMVGNLVGGMFYNQAYRHWFYTLILQALILTEIAGRLTSTPAGRRELPLGMRNSVSEYKP